MRLPLYVHTTLVIIAAGALLSCGTASRTAMLPEGLQNVRVPSDRASAYLYIQTPDSINFSSADLNLEALGLTSAEIMLGPIRREFAMRLTKPHDSTREISFKSPGKSMDEIVVSDADWQQVLIRSSASAWASGVQQSWLAGNLVPFSERYPDAWVELQQLPVNPASQPVAAGFIRNFGSLIDELVAEVGVTVPSLSDSLALIRIDRMVFGAYSNTLRILPDKIHPEMLRNLDTTILLIGRSGYPSAILGPAFTQFIRSLGLHPIDLEGVTVHYHAFSPEMHLIVLRLESHLFFSVASKESEAKRLIADLIRSRAE